MIYLKIHGRKGLISNMVDYVDLFPKSGVLRIMWANHTNRVVKRGHIESDEFDTFPWSKNEFPNLQAYGIRIPPHVVMAMMFWSYSDSALEFDIFAGGRNLYTLSVESAIDRPRMPTAILPLDQHINEPDSEPEIFTWKTGSQEEATSSRLIGSGNPRVSGCILIRSHRPVGGILCKVVMGGGVFRMRPVNIHNKCTDIVRCFGAFDTKSIVKGNGVKIEEPTEDFKTVFRTELVKGEMPVLRLKRLMGSAAQAAAGPQVTLEQGVSMARVMRVQQVPRFERDQNPDTVESIGLCLTQNQHYTLKT